MDNPAILGTTNVGTIVFAFSDGASPPRAVRASLGTPLPIAGPASLPATSTPLTGTYAAVGTKTLGPFTPQLARSIWLLAQASAASGTIVVQRSIDGGTTMPGLTQSRQTWASYTLGAAANGAAFTGTIVNEAITLETSSLATYYIQITLTAGSVTVDLHN